MQPIELLVDIHCARPEWATQSGGNFDKLIYKNEYQHPGYRIYIDENLITERNWYWNDSTLIREHLWVDLAPGKEYTIELDPILIIPEHAKFNLKNFQIIKRNYEVIAEQDHCICFKTYKYKIKERSNETRRIFERR